MTRWDTAVRYASAKTQIYLPNVVAERSNLQQHRARALLSTTNAVSSHVTMFSRREIGFYTHIYQNFNFKLCVVMVLAPTRHPRNGFSRELKNYQGGSCPQLLAKFNINTQRKIPLGIGYVLPSPPDSF